VVVLAGDFNVTFMRSRTLHELTTDWGFSAAGPGIDHVLVQRAPASPVHRWPDDRRALGRVLLSDHAPVEVEVE
jgi:endonuclease/exonuclease/phosphatase family metal-dependent hydrolase